MASNNQRDSPLPKIQRKEGEVHQYKKSIMGGSLKPKYLKLERNYLLIFDTKDTYSPTGTIVRADIHKIYKTPDVAYAFEIRTKQQEIYYFQVANLDMLEEWVAAIENRVPVSVSTKKSQEEVLKIASKTNVSDFPATYKPHGEIFYPHLPKKISDESKSVEFERNQKNSNDDRFEYDKPPPYNTQY